MPENFYLDIEQLPADLIPIAQQVQQAALKRRTDCLELLALLRLLEQLHQDIRDSLFRDVLPDNRQKLYALLRDIEMNGGWPYIQRMKLNLLMENFLQENSPSEDTNSSA